MFDTSEFVSRNRRQIHLDNHPGGCPPCDAAAATQQLGTVTDVVQPVTDGLLVVGGVIDTAGGIVLGTAGAATCSVSLGLGCAAAVGVAAPLTAAGGIQTTVGAAGLVDRALNGFESTEGQRVIDSFSAATHQGEASNPGADLGLATAGVFPGVVGVGAARGVAKNADEVKTPDKDLEEMLPERAAFDDTIDDVAEDVLPSGRVSLEAEEAVPTKLSTPERIKSNVADSKIARESSNLGSGLSFVASKIPSKSVVRLISERNQPRLPTKDSVDKGIEIKESFSGPITARRGKEGEEFEAVSGDSPASLFFVTKGLKDVPAAERRQLLALPVTNTAENFNIVQLLKDQILLEGRVAPQIGGIFGPKRLPGGGQQTVTETGRFGSVGVKE